MDEKELNILFIKIKKKKLKKKKKFHKDKRKTYLKKVVDARSSNSFTDML